MGTLRAIEGARTPPGVWQRRDDEVQPRASQLTQNALVRCRVRGESHATGAPGQADQATSNHRQGAWLSPDVLNDGIPSSPGLRDREPRLDDEPGLLNAVQRQFRTSTRVGSLTKKGFSPPQATVFQSVLRRPWLEPLP